MLLSLTVMSDTDVPSGSLVLVTPCQKKEKGVTPCHTDDFAVEKEKEQVGKRKMFGLWEQDAPI